MAESVLSVTNLHVKLGKKSIIRDLTFTVEAGDCLAIIGPNGAGKSVLLNVLMALLPSQGEVRWRETARLGYIPQKVPADKQLPLRTRDLLEAKAGFLKLGKAEVNSVCDEVGLAGEVVDSPMGTLSGGQFQKALIAFALLGRPNVLLFDEPTASLDEITEERIYELLHTLQSEKAITLILVSHDLSVVYRYANKVLCLSRGRPCMGSPREILTPAMLEELYGAAPRYYQHIEEH
jgi:zinc transport system ATP-binding protein